MKIGVVLSKFPVVSETFINTFLAHLSEHEIYLFAQISRFDHIESNWIYKPYLNKWPNLHSTLLNIFVLCKIPFYIGRFKKLREHGLSYKQLFADANIWTMKKLDYLHFPFGTQIIGREHYAALLGAKSTISFRGSDVNVYPVFHQMSYQPYWKSISKVHCNSIELRDKLVSEHELPLDMNVEIIYPALQEAYQNNEQAQIKIVMERDYIMEHFISIGRLHWVKDYPLIFQALGHLKMQGLQFKYTIIGNGPDKEHLLFLAKELNIDANIDWVGSLSGKAIIEHLKRATLYLQSSLAEGFSNSCLEAQSQGLQCVVTNVSGMQACIQQDVGGCIVQDRNYVSFAESICQIVHTSPEIRRANGIEAAQRVVNQFTIERQKNHWINFFIK